MKNVSMKIKGIFLLLFSVILFSCNFGADSSISAETEYIVNHWQQNIVDDEYTLVSTETLKGYSGNLSEAGAKEYQGFTVRAFSQKSISSNLKIDIKYDRKIITATLKYNGGTEDSSAGSSSEVQSEQSVVSGKYGSAISFPTLIKKGSVLDGWYDVNGNQCSGFFSENATYEASFVEKNSAAYKVHHMLQNIENDLYTEDSDAVVSMEGRTDSTTAAVAKTYEGFNVNKIQQQLIKADDSTEVYVYYDRKPVTFTLHLNNTEEDITVTKKYGTTVTSSIIENPVYAGSTFSGWSPLLPDSFIEDGTYSAKWNLPTYKVKYYFEKIESSAYETDSNFPEETYFGLIGSTTEVKAKSIAGFIPESISQKVVQADNSTVVEIYYRRKIITLYIDLDGGSGNNYIQGKFGKSVTASDLEGLGTPEKASYTFKSYSYASDLTFNMSNDEKNVISVVWEGRSNTTCKVVMNIEKTDYSDEADKYSVYDYFFGYGKTDEYSGMTVDNDAETVSVFNKDISISGFYPVNNRDVKLKADNSTVLNLYFDRKEITLTYDLGEATINEQSIFTVKGKYGVQIPASSVPNATLASGEHCVAFQRWSDNLTVFPDADTTITAVWEYETYKVTYVNTENTEQKVIKEYSYGDEVTALHVSEVNFTAGNSNIGICGWKIDSDSTELDYHYYDTFTCSGDITLYTLWTSRYWSVTCKYSNEIAFLKVYTEDEYCSINQINLNKPGYYITNSEFEENTIKVEDASSMVINYAPKDITVTLILNGGQCENGDFLDSNGRITGKYDASIGLGNITRAGYTLSYKDGKQLPSKFPLEDSVYECIWTLAVYTINYNNLHDVENLNQTTYTENTNTFDLHDLSGLSGYTFAGWYTDKELTNQITKIEKGSSENFELYAKWKANNFFSNTITGVGDIVYEDGTYTHVIDGLDVSLASNKTVVGIISHQYNVGTDESPVMEWRCMGVHPFKTPFSKNFGNYTGLYLNAVSDGYKSLSYYEMYNVTSLDMFNGLNEYGTKYKYSDFYSDSWYCASVNEFTKSDGLKNNWNEINRTLQILRDNEYMKYKVESAGVVLQNFDNRWTCNSGDTSQWVWSGRYSPVNGNPMTTSMKTSQAWTSDAGLFGYCTQSYSLICVPFHKVGGTKVSRPAPVSNVQLNYSGSALRLSWTAPENCNKVMITYTDLSTRVALTETVEGSNTFTLSGVSSSDQYKFDIIACNSEDRCSKIETVYY